MLDEQIVALAKAIRQHETGNRTVAGQTGELSSRYQFLPSTWQAEAKRILGNANAPLTLENENKVAYTRMKEWKDKGYNPGQIASMWNSGNPDMYAKGEGGVGKSSANPNITFNVPKYVNEVYSLYNQYKPAPYQEPEYKQLDKQNAEIFKPTFQEKQVLPQFSADTEQNKSFISSTAKTIGNIPGSLWNFGKGILEFLNPLNTKKAVEQLGSDIVTNMEESKQGLATPNFIDVLKEVPQAAKQTLLPKIVQDWWDVGASAFKGGISGQNEELDKALAEVYRTSVNDPMNIAPVILVASGVAKKVGLGRQFDTAITKTAKPIIDTFKKTGEGIKSTIGKSAGFVASQTTGLNPETIKQVILKPESFTSAEMAKMERGTLADRVKTSLDARIKDLSETGKGYNEIRQGSAIVEVNPTKIAEVFDKYGIKFDNTGKIIRDVETPPLKPGDITAFEDFQRIFGDETYLSSNAFLNARTTLSEMAKYDSTKTGLSEVVSRDLRKVYDEIGKTQLPRLKALDEKYAPEVKELKQLKKDYLKPDGTLKDGAMNKIANLTGKGKDLILARLEKLTPGITEDIKVLKAVEDIQLSGGQKVGTYVRAGLTGGLLATGNPLIAIAQLLLSQPAIVIPLLRAFGKARGIKVSIINSIIDKLKRGVSLTVGEQGILNQSIDDVVKKIGKSDAGLSIKDITKDPLAQEATKNAQKIAIKNRLGMVDKLTGLFPNAKISSGIKGYRGEGAKESLKNKVIAHSGKVDELFDILGTRVIAKEKELPKILDTIRENFKVEGVQPPEQYKALGTWPYDGFNIKVKLADGSNAEIQLHTPESMAVIDLTHLFWKKWQYIKEEKMTLEQKAEYNSDRQKAFEFAGDIKIKLTDKNLSDIKNNLIKNNGITYDLLKKQNLADSETYAVSLYPERTAHPTEITDKFLIDYISQNRDLFSQKGNNLGGYFDTNTGQWDIDVTYITSDFKKGIELGKKYNQKSIWDLKNAKPIDTGGTGENIGQFGDIYKRIY